MNYFTFLKFFKLSRIWKIKIIAVNKRNANIVPQANNGNMKMR